MPETTRPMTLEELREELRSAEISYRHHEGLRFSEVVLERLRAKIKRLRKMIADKEADDA